MATFLAETLMTLKKTETNTLTVKCVKSGNIFLTIAIAIGFLMALAIGAGVSVDLSRLLPIHIVLVLFGYVTITIIGLSMILLPMFGLAHGYDDKDVNLSFKVIVYSIITYSIAQLIGITFVTYLALISIGIGIVLYLKQLITLYKIRARKNIDIWYKYIYTAFISLGLALFFGLIWLFFDAQNALKVAIWLLVMGFFAFVIVGHLLKIIPFLVWFERFSPLVGKKKVPMLHEMLPNKDVEFAFYFSMIGLVVSAFGLLFASDSLFKGGATLIAFGSIFTVKTVYYILNFKDE